MKKRQQNNKTHTNVNESGTMLHILRRKTWICVNVSGWNFICLLNHLSFFFWRWSVIFHSKLSIGLCGNRFQQRLSSLFFFYFFFFEYSILLAWLFIFGREPFQMIDSVNIVHLSLTHTDIAKLAKPIHCNTIWFEEKDWRRKQNSNKFFVLWIYGFVSY